MCSLRSDLLPVDDKDKRAGSFGRPGRETLVQETERESERWKRGGTLGRAPLSSSRPARLKDFLDSTFEKPEHKFVHGPQREV